MGIESSGKNAVGKEDKGYQESAKYREENYDYKVWKKRF